MASISQQALAAVDTDYTDKTAKATQNSKGTKEVLTIEILRQGGGSGQVRTKRDVPVPQSGITYREAQALAQRHIEKAAGDPCKFFYERNYFCTYTTSPAAKPKPKPAKKDDPATPQDERLVTVITITPAEAAQIAVASLKLPQVKPGIGPDPSINQWKMAAVGYPYWLWADGPTSVGQVSQSVGNLNVALSAQLTSVSYDMGDGNTVTCDGPGVKWHRGIPPAKESACGYRYEMPSLPDGSYTVTATSYWDIAWTVGGESGVIAMTQTGTRELPVGELQVLVH